MTLQAHGPTIFPSSQTFTLLTHPDCLLRCPPLAASSVAAVVVVIVSSPVRNIRHPPSSSSSSCRSRDRRCWCWWWWLSLAPPPPSWNCRSNVRPAGSWWTAWCHCWPSIPVSRSRTPTRRCGSSRRAGWTDAAAACRTWADPFRPLLGCREG